MSKRIISPKTKEYQHTLSVLAWSVRAILHYGKQKSSKTDAKLTLHFTLQTKHRKTGHSFLIYKREIYRLLNAPKNDFDQIALELPCFMGFRASEVGTWRIEYIDFQYGETLVFDAKKHMVLPVPLNTHVARLAMKVIGDREEGYVLRHRSNAWKGRKEPITNKGIWDIWKKYAYALDLYPEPKDYSPLTGRRFFAALWYHKLKKSIVTLSRIMRHSDPKQTLDYVNHLIFAEDVERDYRDFERKVMRDMMKVKVKP